MTLAMAAPRIMRFTTLRLRLVGLGRVRSRLSCARAKRNQRYLISCAGNKEGYLEQSGARGFF